MRERPLHIGIVCYPTTGGSGIVATDLAIGLACRGDRVTLISYAQPVRMRGYVPNLDFHEVQTEDYPVFHHAPYTLSLAASITTLARSLTLDVVHAHYAVPHATAAYLAKQILAPKALPVVTTLHGTDITLVGSHPSFYETTRFSILHSDRVTAVSSWLEQETRRTFKIDLPIRVIPNFVDAQVFRPRDPRAPRRLPDGRPIILHASNFRQVKNLPAVVEVFQRVRALLPCRLALVGHGPERPWALGRLHELGLQDDTILMGLQDEVEQILAEGDLLLLPSEHESFGLVALEAMACGVPVVTTNRGGTVEVVEEGCTGFLRDPHDIDGMTEAVLTILRDRDLRLEMGRRARERAVQSFSVDRTVELYRGLYLELLSQR